MYSVGDYVVKANSGICKVEDILHPEALCEDNDRLYYLLIPQAEQSAKIYVPVDTGNASIRKVLSADMAWNIIKEIPYIDEANIVNDKDREQEYKEAIKSCDPENLVSVIKTIYFRRKKREAQGKKSTEVDDRYYRLAGQALISELAFAIGKSSKDIAQIIQDTVNEQRDRISYAK